MSDSADILGNGRQAGFQVGPVRIEGRAVLAPMSGVTDIAMRRIARRFGASLVVTEMVAADAYARGDAANRLKAEGAGVSPHMVQIAGCEPRWMGEAARIAEDSGAAIIDINMGCPAKKVTAGYAGSHLMRDLTLAVDLIRAAVRAVRIPVTLKMRLGWDAGSLNAPELGRLAESEGVAMLTVHGRTRCQFYAGRADWGAIRAVKAAVSIPGRRQRRLRQPRRRRFDAGGVRRRRRDDRQGGDRAALDRRRRRALSGDGFDSRRARARRAQGRGA